MKGILPGRDRAPLIVHWPGSEIAPGTFSDHPAHFIDIMATFADLTGADYPDSANGDFVYPMAGESLLPAFFGESYERKAPLFWQWRRGRAVLDGPWKIVRDGHEAPWELFHMNDDPSELNNLAGEEPGTVDRFDSLFRVWEAGVR